MLLTFVLSMEKITLLLVLVMSENPSSILYCHFYMFFVLKTFFALLLIVYLLGKVKKNSFRNFLRKKKKVTDFFYNF